MGSSMSTRTRLGHTRHQRTPWSRLLLLLLLLLYLFLLVWSRRLRRALGRVSLESFAFHWRLHWLSTHAHC